MAESILSYRWWAVPSSDGLAYPNGYEIEIDHIEDGVIFYRVWPNRLEANQSYQAYHRSSEEFSKLLGQKDAKFLEPRDGW